MNERAIKCNLYSNGEKIIILNIDNQKWIRMDKKLYDKINDTNKMSNIIDRYGLDRLSNKSESFKSIYLIVTKKCNMSCDFCFMNSGPDVDIKDDMTVSNFIDKLSPYINENVNKIVISGGEPLVKKDIFKLLKWININIGKGKIIFQTNGILLNEKILKELEKYVFAIELSIEYPVYEDVFLKRIDKLAKYIVSSEISIVFSYVVNFENIDNLKNALSLARKYNAIFHMRLVEPIGRAKNELIIDWNKYYNLAISAYKKYAEFIVENNCYDDLLFDGSFINLFPQKNCGAYGNVLSIHPNGDLFPCGSIYNEEYLMGNIVEDRVQNIDSLKENYFLKKNIKQSFCVEHKSKCKLCEYKFFCNGICGAVDIDVDKNYFSYQCKLRKDLLYFEMFIREIEWTKEEYCKNFIDYIDDLGRNRNEIRYEEKVYKLF